MASTDPSKYSPEKTKLLAENGWDKGLVLFGFLGSETTVRVNTALRLLTSTNEFNDFPYKEEDIVFVELSIDDKPLHEKKGGIKTMGTVSEEWLTLSEGKHYMPAIAIEGKLYTESAEIVKFLHETFPDKRLSKEEHGQVTKWIDMVIQDGDKVQDAERHWGWCHFAPKDKGNLGFGEGNKDLEWEKERIELVDKFCKIQDDHFAKMEGDKMYFVAGKYTLADCAMIGFPLGLIYIARLKVDQRYPNLWAHHLALQATKPKGAEDHYFFFPILGKIISIVGAWRRGIFSYAFHIENPKYWE